MTAEYRLKEAVRQWRADISDRLRLSSNEMDRFELTHGNEIATILGEALPILRARGGEVPDTAEDFAAYDAIVERERPRDGMEDGAVLRRLRLRIDRQLAQGGTEWSVFQDTAREYVVARAEAMVLRERGWDAVALLITKAPAIAVVASGTVVAVRNPIGDLYIHPDRLGTLDHLHADMHKAETKVMFLMSMMKATEPKNTKESLDRFAAELWKLVRKAKIEGEPSRPSKEPRGR